MAEWTHPICWVCWERRAPGKSPLRLRNPPPEKCCICGEETKSGIFIREDPAKVKFPAQDGEDTT
jgi:hypothetical protein